MEGDKSRIQQNANQLATRGQFDKAIAEWKKLLVDSPADGAIHNTIGDLYLKSHAPADAIEAYFRAGAAFQAAGSALKAIAVYKKILKIDPACHKVYQNLGDLNAGRGMVTNAVSDYLTLSKLYLKAGQTRDALTVYRKIVAVCPTSVEGMRRLAELCLQENLRDEAIKTYLQLGKECWAQKRPLEAREAYEAVLKLDSANAQALQLLDNPDKAVSKKETGVGVLASLTGDANRQQALNQATRQIETGEYEKTERLLSDLLGMYPGDPKVCRLLALLHIKRGELVVAAGEIQFLAEAAIRAQDFEVAESMIREYLTVDGTCVPLLELLGSLYERKEDADAAVRQYEKAVKVLLEHPDPETPNRPAELINKIRVLVPASPLVDQLMRNLTQEQSPEQQPCMVEPTESEASTEPKVEVEDAKQMQVDRLADGEAAIPQSESVPVAGPDARISYALGIAYKNMGLVDEAIEEFKLAVTGRECFFDASSMLAGCLKEKGLLEPAMEYLERAVAAHLGRGEQETMSMRYELGLLYESAGLAKKALGIFSAIPSFLDVPMRLQRLQGAGGAELAEDGAVAMDARPSSDGMLVTEKATAPGRKKRRISYL